MTLSTRQVQQQRLLLAPQVTLSLQVLQMSTLELQAYLHQQAEQNPLLDVRESPSETPLPDSGAPSSGSTGLGDDWGTPNSRSAASESPDNDDEGDRTDPAALNHWLVGIGTLHESLKRQLGCIPLTESERKLAECLIERLDSNGYLEESLEALSRETGLPEKKLEEALSLVQQLDPPGVGARDLRECLLLQLQAMLEGKTIAYEIVERHFGLFMQSRPVALARATQASLEEVELACARIRRLNPKPGAAAAGAMPQAIIPDLIMRRNELYYDIELNDHHVPHICINRNYYRMLRDPSTTDEVRNFLQEKFKQAGWVVRAIDERNATLLAIGRCLISLQSEFIDRGPQALRPLTQAQVAASVGRHPSTVSRAIAGKTIDTPCGIFRLEELFATAVPQGADRTVSDASIKSEIARLVREENPEDPLSDDAIVRRLQERQLSIARRTVAKYRTSLHILPARLRRRRLD